MIKADLDYGAGGAVPVVVPVVAVSGSCLLMSVGRLPLACFSLM